MKTKFLKVLHIFGLDALILRLFEKLLADLNKKFQALQEAFSGILCCQAIATAL